MRLTTACVLLLLTVTGCSESSVQQQVTPPNEATTTQQTSSPENMTDTPKSDEALLADALQKIKSGAALLVDVRSDEEWDEAHFATATHIPIDNITDAPEAAFAEIKKEQTVFIH